MNLHRSLTKVVPPPKVGHAPAIHPEGPCVFDVDLRPRKTLPLLLCLGATAMFALDPVSFTGGLLAVAVQSATLALFVRGTVTLDSARRQVVFRNGLAGIGFRKTCSYNDVDGIRLEREHVTVGRKTVGHSVLKLYWMNPARPPTVLATSIDHDKLSAFARVIDERSGLKVEIPSPTP